MNSTSQPAAVGPARADETAFDALDVCHRNTALTLGRLAALITQLSRGEPDTAARELAHQILGHFNIEIREHHRDEELHVFPALAAKGDADLADTLARLRQDHAWIEQDWAELAPHLDAIANGQSWFDIDVLREGSGIFISLCHAHVALEESVIYPQARHVLSPEQLRTMRSEMVRRRRIGSRGALRRQQGRGALTAY